MFYNMNGWFSNKPVLVWEEFNMKQSYWIFLFIQRLSRIGPDEQQHRHQSWMVLTYSEKPIRRIVMLLWVVCILSSLLHLLTDEWTMWDGISFFYTSPLPWFAAATKSWLYWTSHVYMLFFEKLNKYMKNKLSINILGSNKIIIIFVMRFLTC